MASFRIRSAPERARFLRNESNFYRFSLSRTEPLPFCQKPPLLWHRLSATAYLDFRSKQIELGDERCPLHAAALAIAGSATVSSRSCHARFSSQSFAMARRFLRKRSSGRSRLQDILLVRAIVLPIESMNVCARLCSLAGAGSWWIPRRIAVTAKSGLAVGNEGCCEIRIRSRCIFGERYSGYVALSARDRRLQGFECGNEFNPIGARTERCGFGSG